MDGSKCVTSLMQISICIAFAANMPSSLFSDAYSQEPATKQPPQSTKSLNGTVKAVSDSKVRMPPELQLAGVWSFVATTHGVPSEGGGDLVQRGHWAIAYEGGAYMTAYSFDKVSAFGRKFLIYGYARNDKWLIEQIDIEANYTKRLGIWRIIDGGSSIELAFNIPPNGFPGALPTSFDSRSEPNGFVSIVLKRLSGEPTTQGMVTLTDERSEILSKSSVEAVSNIEKAIKDIEAVTKKLEGSIREGATTSTRN